MELNYLPIADTFAEALRSAGALACILVGGRPGRATAE
jgi:ethanolamine ammonia-lyase small subunit